MVCTVCNRGADHDTAGFRFRPVTFFFGPKSERMIPEDDAFPDGEEEKFICFHCCPPELLDLLGFEGGT